MSRKKAVVPALTYLLRTCNADMSAYSGFLWPESGPVAAPDWSPAVICGYGLHGLLLGEGDGSLLSWAPDAKWLVVEVEAATVVQLDGKVKVPRGRVVYCGERGGAIEFLSKVGGNGAKMVGGQATASGYGGQATASGARGQATASGRHGLAIGERVASGESGTIILRYWDGTAERYRFKVGYVGEEGIEAYFWYSLDNVGAWRKGEPLKDEELPEGERARRRAAASKSTDQGCGRRAIEPKSTTSEGS